MPADPDPSSNAGSSEPECCGAGIAAERPRGEGRDDGRDWGSERCAAQLVMIFPVGGMTAMAVDGRQVVMLATAVMTAMVQIFRMAAVMARLS